MNEWIKDLHLWSCLQAPHPVSSLPQRRPFYLSDKISSCKTAFVHSLWLFLTEIQYILRYNSFYRKTCWKSWTHIPYWISLPNLQPTKLFNDKSREVLVFRVWRFPDGWICANSCKVLYISPTLSFVTANTSYHAFPSPKSPNQSNQTWEDSRNGWFTANQSHK